MKCRQERLDGATARFTAKGGDPTKVIRLYKNDSKKHVQPLVEGAAREVVKDQLDRPGVRVD